MFRGVNAWKLIAIDSVPVRQIEYRRVARGGDSRDYGCSRRVTLFDRCIALFKMTP